MDRPFTINVFSPDLDDEEREAIRATFRGRADALIKAVAAHPSQIQARTRGGMFRRVSSWRAMTPRGTDGRFVARLTPSERSAAASLADEYQAAFGTRMRWHMGDLLEDRMSASEAAQRGAEEIRHYYELMYRTGLQEAGNPGLIITPVERALINRLVADETDYWRNFMSDVAAGRGTVPYPDRVAMYANAARQMRWTGFVFGCHAPRRRIVWQLGPTEHCETCLSMAKKSPWKVDDFIRQALAHGYVPQGGDLECKGIHCRCSLSETNVARK